MPNLAMNVGFQGAPGKADVPLLLTTFRASRDARVESAMRGNANIDYRRMRSAIMTRMITTAARTHAPFLCSLFERRAAATTMKMPTKVSMRSSDSRSPARSRPDYRRPCRLPRGRRPPRRCPEFARPASGRREPSAFSSSAPRRTRRIVIQPIEICNATAKSAHPEHGAPDWGWSLQRNWLVILRRLKRSGTGMIYCCGVLVRDGLVMIADTRTNAGLGNVSTFRKLHIFSKPGERSMAIAPAGNLAISQSVLSTLTEGLEDPHTGDIETLMNAPTMFQAAQRIGRAIRNVHSTEGEALKSEDVSFDVSFLFGGQIKGSKMRLFMVYTAGNFIECTTDTPYLQIGEHKHGKPVLDRAMHYDVELYEALKTSLISMDSTMRSNLGVGLPIDVLVVRTDVCDADLNHRIEAGEPYFHDLRSRWSAALRAAHQNIPRPPYKTETEPKT